MKAPDFAYARPKTLSAALDLLADDSVDAVPLAGGQSLMPMMNFRLAAPDLLIDLGDLDELRGIAVTGTHVEIGAMTTYADLAVADEVRAHAPLIQLALPHIAHSAIRNRGTLGGSVALADPAAEMPAVLIALDAEITLAGPGTTRKVPADDFFIGLYETAREEHELVTAIAIPRAARGQRIGFYELARRHGDYAMAGVAVADPGGRYRIAFFGVGDRACRAVTAEQILADAAADPAAAQAQALDALDELEFAGDPSGSEATKRHLARVVLTRALEGMAA